MLPYWSVAVMVRLSPAPAVGVVVVAESTKWFADAGFTVMELEVAEVTVPRVVSVAVIV